MNIQRDNLVLSVTKLLVQIISGIQMLDDYYVGVIEKKIKKVHVKSKISLQ